VAKSAVGGFRPGVNLRAGGSQVPAVAQLFRGYPISAWRTKTPNQRVSAAVLGSNLGESSYDCSLMTAGPPNTVSHPTAVLIIATVATVWGFGFPMTRIVLDGGLSVGAQWCIRFTFTNSRIKPSYSW